MRTDIHARIGFRHPGTGTDYDDVEPWVAAIDLRPLYDETDCHGCDWPARATAFRPRPACSVESSNGAKKSMVM
ncbi:hypothetical protein [Streptomyces sp. NPDC004528]|uniref:hypothetical protein n=1 Tax=Streptomyces sp. NPDC004528 TaxID=3154550 RepID=UPI0033A5BA5A